MASPVGANREVVLDGWTGFWASADGEWAWALRRLCDDVTLRKRMDTAARVVARRDRIGRAKGARVQQRCREWAGC